MKAVIKIWLLALVMGIITIAFIDWSIANAAASDKNDGGCPQAYTTVGRCADKCPKSTDNLVGYDKETGAAICNAAPTGCPYGDSVPLGPECDKLAPQAANLQSPVNVPATNTEPPQYVDTSVSDFKGK